MQGWTATVRHGVTTKNTKKNEKELESLFLKSPQPLPSRLKKKEVLLNLDFRPFKS